MYTATTEIYTLSLHDALPISNTGGSEDTMSGVRRAAIEAALAATPEPSVESPKIDPAPLNVVRMTPPVEADRKSTRLNSSHVAISYAVFCLKKKKINQEPFFS